VFDQQCAAEKRKKRKRGLQPLAEEFVWINSTVCENCGDCSTQSNCLSIIPTETKLGTKRKIDYDNCNYSYDCLDGFCPSFATIKGQRPAKNILNPTLPDIVDVPHSTVQMPERYNMLVAGIGGTGVISTSQMMCVASHIDGIKVISTDQTGLAQKYGAVTSTISVGEKAFGRMFPKSANVVIGIDPQVTGMADSVRYIGPDTTVILNTKISPNSEIIQNRDWNLEPNDIIELLKKQCKEVIALDFSSYAKKLTGNALMVNMLMLGYAYEKCLIPYHELSMMQAIEANGVVIELNKKAWTLGRHLAIINSKEAIDREIKWPIKETFNSQFYHRRDILIKYQDEAYAQMYVDLVIKAQVRDSLLKETGFSTAVMLNLYKLMAYKDEYEVARIWSETPELKYQSIHFYMSLPWQRKSQKKTKLPPVTKYLFHVLKHGKKLRGTRFDPLGFSYERRLERKIRNHYIKLVNEWIENINSDNYSNIEGQAKLPNNIRGYGHIKLLSIRNCNLFKDIT
jgi:indolepyruvate ferredoxin oxidoreductase